MPIVQSNNFARPRPVFFMLVLAVLLLFLPRLALADKEVPEYHVKAVFLYNLASFVTWPEDWHRDADTFVIGIYGNDPFGTLIDQTVAGEQRQGKPIEIIRYKDIGELKTPSCDILFISSSITENFSEIRTALSLAQKAQFATGPRAVGASDACGLTRSVVRNVRMGEWPHSSFELVLDDSP